MAAPAALINRSSFGPIDLRAQAAARALGDCNEQRYGRRFLGLSARTEDVEYTVSCDCGKSHAVSAGAAGTRLSCACGRQVVVPSLHILRMQAGEAVLSPEILIEVALSQGELPTSQTCVRCGEVTDHTAFVWAELERAQIKRPSWTINPIGLLFGWLVLSRSGQVRVLGRDRAYRLPIRLCEDCCPLRRRELREAVAQEPLYRQLLDKYPPGAAVALQSMR